MAEKVTSHFKENDLVFFIFEGQVFLGRLLPLSFFNENERQLRKIERTVCVRDLTFWKTRKIAEGDVFQLTVDHLDEAASKSNHLCREDFDEFRNLITLRSSATAIIAFQQEKTIYPRPCLPTPPDHEKLRIFMNAARAVKRLPTPRAEDKGTIDAKLLFKQHEDGNLLERLGRPQILEEMPEAYINYLTLSDNIDVVIPRGTLSTYHQNEVVLYSVDRFVGIGIVVCKKESDILVMDCRTTIEYIVSTQRICKITDFAKIKPYVIDESFVVKTFQKYVENLKQTTFEERMKNTGATSLKFGTVMCVNDTLALTCKYDYRLNGIQLSKEYHVEGIPRKYHERSSSQNFPAMETQCSDCRNCQGAYLAGWRARERFPSNMFVCPFDRQQFHTNEDLQVHMQFHDSCGNFPATSTSSAFSSSNIPTTMSEASALPQPSTAPTTLPEQTTSGNDELQRRKPFKCPHCSFLSKSKDSLRHHVKKHSESDKNEAAGQVNVDDGSRTKCVVEGCQMMVSTVPVFRRQHHEKYHQENSITCDFCAKIYYNDAASKSHISRCKWKKEYITKKSSYWKKIKTMQVADGENIDIRRVEILKKLSKLTNQQRKEKAHKNMLPRVPRLYSKK